MSQSSHPFRKNSSAPTFPGLYIPTGSITDGNFLYDTGDVWQYTLLWTIIFYEAFHIAASLYAAAVQPQNWKFSWLVVILYIIVGGIEALIAGSVVGLM